MSLKSLLRELAGERGLKIDEDELDTLGLADDDADAATGEGVDVLSESLPGRAAGQVEIFLAAESTATSDPVEKDGLMWYPIIRSGQWAVRPGITGKKRRVPLKVVAGKSKNQRREIGLQDLLDAHNDEAVQHVTVPMSHSNTLPENQGFVDKMKIVDGEVKDQTTKKMVAVKVLMGGYRITEPDTKGKMTRGTYANRSAGILYDFVNTETGKTYPAVIEHVALTNKPWITGMANFGRKLTGTSEVEVVGMSLSDEGPDEQEYMLSLSDEAQLEDEGDFLAQESATWSKEDSPNWLRGQVNSLLEEARAKKIQAKRGANSSPSYFAEYPPCYRCVEAKPGSALISDGYSDDSNFWTAGITVKNGGLELDEFSKWTAIKKAFIPDERPAPTGDKLPLDQSKQQGPASVPKSRLELAREARRRRAHPELDTQTTPREVVDNMAGENGTLTLSEEAQAAIQAADARAKAAEDRAEKLSDQVTRLVGTVNGGEVEKYIAHLKDPKGLGLSEELGFGGVLVEIRQLMLSDDGEPAVQSDHFAQDGNSTGELTLSDAIKRIFGAFEKATEGKKKLGEILSQPADGEIKLDADGNPIVDDDEEDKAGTKTVQTGKPPVAGEDEVTHLSHEQRKAALLAQMPSLAAAIGHRPEITVGGDK